MNTRCDDDVPSLLLFQLPVGFLDKHFLSTGDHSIPGNWIIVVKKESFSSDQRIPSTHHSLLLLILNSQNFCWQHSRTRLHLLNQTRTKLSDLKLGWGVTPNNNINKNKILWYYFVCVSTWKCFFFKFRKKTKTKSLFCGVGYKLQLLLPIDTFQNSDYSCLYRYLKSVCDKE